MTNTQNGVRYEIRNNLVGKYYTQEIVFGHCYQLNLQLIWSAVFPLNISFSVHIRPHCIALSWGCLGKTKTKPKYSNSSKQIHFSNHGRKWNLCFWHVVHKKCPSRDINRREWIQLKGCVFSPPSLAPVPGTRKRNLSIGSLPTALEV